MPRKRKASRLEMEVSRTSTIAASAPITSGNTSTTFSTSKESGIESASSRSVSSLPVLNPSKKTTPIFFWRETHASTGYLSQWYPCTPFCDPDDTDPKVYKTAEHYMMHQKAILFGDEAIAVAILDADHPRKVKRLGRAVQGFDEEVWDREREGIVKRANWCKFTYPVDVGNSAGSEDGPAWKLGVGKDAKEVKTPSFRQVLLSTGNRELVEASPYDRIWGIGFREADAEQNRDSWGLNLLGKALMAVREEFKLEEEKAKKAVG